MPNPSMKTIAADFTNRLMKDQSLRDAMEKALTLDPKIPHDNINQNLANLITQALKLPEPFPVDSVNAFSSEMQLLCNELVATEKFLNNLPVASFWTNA